MRNAADQCSRPFARRRWTFALVAATAMAVVSLSAPWSGAQAVEQPAPTVTVVVGEGQTVWDLALPYLPEGVDPTVFVARVVAANDVDAGALVPGAVLRVPLR